ncbi:hypothetical protein [Microbacterium schleiferi]|uniref:hypothetical protein n=1 Tax=Microbacterium schleiferi TaxID=69362 RepID=UPI001D175E58|nr:hypothetical protein [Microbacterium schleiferi]MCC4266266.1 hypothetical protein [Microbacterium schleiferi]
MSFTNDDRFLRQATETERRRLGMDPRSIERSDEPECTPWPWVCGLHMVQHPNLAHRSGDPS